MYCLTLVEDCKNKLFYERSYNYNYLKSVLPERLPPIKLPLLLPAETISD
jgi:hypothetical protein